MSQVQIDFSKVAVQDLSSQARPRTTTLPRTDDFASMLDPGNDHSSTPAHIDTSARSGRRTAVSPSHRTDSTAPADRLTSGGIERTDAASNIKGNSQRPATDRAGIAQAADKGSAPRKVADTHDEVDQGASTADSGQGDGRAEPDNGTAVATVVTPETVLASVAPVAQPTALAGTTAFAGDEAAAQDSTSIAVTVTALSAVQSGTADTTHADAETGQVTENRQPATPALAAALAQKKAGGETVAADDEPAPPEPAVADASSKTVPTVEKPAKGRELRATATATAPAGGNSSADEQQIQPLAPDAADGAKAQVSPETVSEDAQARLQARMHAENAAGKSETKEASDDGAGVRTNEPRIGAIQAGAGANSAAPITSVGAHPGIGAIGSASAAAGSATASPPTSRTDAAGTAVPLTDVGVEIATQASAGRRSFDIRLDPPELGHIRVRLDVDRDGHVVSRLVVDRAETLDLLRRDAPQLERALQDAGLKADAQTMQFSLRQQNAGQQDGQPPQRSATHTADVEAAARLDEVPSSYGRLANRAGGIDIRI